MKTLNLHLNAPKLRMDAWNAVAEDTNRLHGKKLQKEETAYIHQKIQKNLNILHSIEYYNAFPGELLIKKIESHLNQCEYHKLFELVSLIIYSFRLPNCNYKKALYILNLDEIDTDKFYYEIQQPKCHYFEVLVVADTMKQIIDLMKQEFEACLNENDTFVYQLLFVPSVQDAMISVMLNYHIKACLITDYFQLNTKLRHHMFKNLLSQVKVFEFEKNTLSHTPQQAELEEKFITAAKLAYGIKNLRAREIDLYYIANHDPEKRTHYLANYFNRIFYHLENYFELHFAIMQGIKSRYETPFFDALKKYALEPKNTFHALPVARGKSIFKSRWAQDMHEFYGKNIFIAESSATIGGLDSILNPKDSIKQAMEKASQYFGSLKSFFVTNGTSAANKIVLQAVLQPGSVAMLEHACHESHFYGMVTTGAHVIFLNGYGMNIADIVGPVPLNTIKQCLLNLKKNGLLDKLQLIVLSNCTFDGLVYNVEKYMEEILAIKPDIHFLWDEAWFSFARCVPHYRQRTAMQAAAKLAHKYKTPEYRKKFQAFKALMEKNGRNDDWMLKNALLPDPDLVKIRVYATQSIHKTLSSLRQGSMIHIYVEDFKEFEEQFFEAYIAHSTSSPNYQIIATMDLARRQADLEGYELVQNAIELSMIFRNQVNTDPQISCFFQALGPSELIPLWHRKSKVSSGYLPERDWLIVEKAWEEDDFVLDPTRVTLLIKQGFSGFFMKHELMRRFGIQVNKVSLNSILVQFNIGTSRSSASFLLQSLLEISKTLHGMTQKPITINKAQTIPEFSGFGPLFSPHPHLPIGDIRMAYYAGKKKELVEFMPLSKIIKRMRQGAQIICASIIIPYPPGYPLLVPGQIIKESVIHYLQSIDCASILAGYSIQQGLKIFRIKE